MKDVPFHEAADIFPLMMGDDFDGLVNDIRDRGQMSPIELLDGEIIDGRNRYRACLEVPCEPDFCDVDGLPEAKDDPVAYVVSMNLHRRHLTPSQCAIASAKAEKASGTQGKAAKGRKKRKPKSVVENSPQQNGGKARDKAGEQFGISGKTHDAGVKVLDQGSATLVKAVETGDVSVSAAAKLAELPKAEQNAAVKEGRTAIKAAISPPKPPKEVSSFPLSDKVCNWMGSLGGIMTWIRTDHGSLAELIAETGWDSKKTKTIMRMIDAASRELIELNKEAKKHAKG